MGKRQQTNGNLALKAQKVIVIEAAERPEAEKLRVAAYCRVSSDSSDQLNSFVAQLNHYTTLISSKENWILADLYADEGISGTSAEKRPDFQRLISDCRKGLVDKILVKSISRFARNAKDCLETIRELKSIGVGVYFEEQNIDTSNMTGELLTAVFAAIAQKESESLSAKMRWSYQYRMKSGTFLPAAVPFGYMLQDKKIMVDEERAKLVRQIFSDYLSGKSMDEIADRLNQENVPVRMRLEHRKWRHSAISYILSNEAYLGNSIWQKTYAKDGLPSYQVRNHGEHERYFVEDTHPPIIDKDTFLAAQALKRKRNEYRTTRSSEAATPLHRMIRCDLCGTLYTRKNSRGKIYWSCRKHDRNKDDCPAPRIPEPEIHAAFLRLYHKLRLHGESILTQMIDHLQAVRERQMLWSLDIVELNKRISDIMNQDQMLASMNQCGCVDPDIFISQSNELARQLRKAKQEKEQILSAKSDDTIPRTRELLEALEIMPEYLHTFDAEIFRELVEQITVLNGDTLRFRLKNGLELAERIERTMR